MYMSSPARALLLNMNSTLSGSQGTANHTVTLLAEISSLSSMDSSPAAMLLSLGVKQLQLRPRREKKCDFIFSS